MTSSLAVRDFTQATRDGERSPRIPFTAAAAVTAAIDRLGRTEDVRFSPSGRRIALAGYVTNRVLVIDVRVTMESGRLAIALERPLDISSASLQKPHGVCWLDERTLAVANRFGHLEIFELPEAGAGGAVTLTPFRTIGADHGDLVKKPGSVSAFPIGLGLFELLVCNNLVGHVSRHLIDRRNDCAPLASGSAICAGLRLPDGVAHSRSGRWIAVSNHEAHCILLYRNDDTLHDGSVPAGTLRGVGAPHGLVFTQDERWLLAADGGAPFIHLFHSADASWDGDREPATSIHALSDATYERGRFAPAEGGPKGIDLSPDGALLVATCQEDRVVFLDIRPLLGGVVSSAALTATAEAERARAYLLRYLREARFRVDDTTAAIRRTSEREMQLLLSSRWWRLVAPLRRMSGWLHTAACRARHRLTRAG